MPLNYNGTNIDRVYFNGTQVFKVYLDGILKYAKLWLTFDEQGGTSVTDQYVYYGNTYGTLPTPTRTGYTFLGWFTASSGGTLIMVHTEVTATTNHTLYAHWGVTKTATPVVTFDSYYTSTL